MSARVCGELGHLQARPAPARPRRGLATPCALESTTTRSPGGQRLAVEHLVRRRTAAATSFTGITPVWRNSASTVRSESPPPVFTATIGFVLETRRASRVNLRGLPNDAMCNAITDVALVSLPVLEEVVRAHVRLVPERDEVRDADAGPMGLLEQGHAERARLAGERDPVLGSA